MKNFALVGAVSLILFTAGHLPENEGDRSYKVSSKAELRKVIEDEIRLQGNEADMNRIDTSLITDMRGLFQNKPNFDGDVSGWNVSNVTDMGYMFSKAASFNGDVSDWDVSNVANMSGMFSRATVFNQDISDWNVGEVTDMRYMFDEASAFNQDISGWNVGKVADHTDFQTDSGLNPAHTPLKFR